VPERRKKNDDNPTDAPSGVESRMQFKIYQKKKNTKGDCVSTPLHLRVNISPSINGDQYRCRSTTALVSMQIKRYQNENSPFRIGENNQNLHTKSARKNFVEVNRKSW
jgi:hypothetical protein